MKEFIDLGLPSGNLWASENEEGYYDFEQAKERFGAQLPKASAWMELIEQCTWEWDAEKKGTTVTGPNGNSIFLPAKGFCGNSGLLSVGSYGYYWSSAANGSDDAYRLGFDDGNVYVNDNNRYDGFSVRLFRESKKNTDDYVAAFQRAKEAIKEGLDRETIERIFPELKESEDERLRKALIKAVEYYPTLLAEDGFTKQNALAWLERQKEQEPAEWSEEDEKMMKFTLQFLDYHKLTDPTAQSCKDWLKSLRPQPQK